MSDGFDWVNAMSDFKAGIDMLRGAVGLVRDVQSALPEGDKKQAVEEALAQSESQIKIAEAQIAKGLGYELCKCQFPPTPMLTVGYRTRGEGGTVYECPICKMNTASPFTFQRITKP